MVREPALPMGWGAFAARIAVSLAWLIASQLAGGAATSAGLPPVARAVAASFVGGSVMIWVVVLLRRRKRVDEFDGELINTALMSGAVWALMFGPLTLAVSTISAAAGMPAQPLHETALSLLCSQAPLAALFGEANAQVARWRAGRPARA